MKFTSAQKSSFTLIELLIVIVIIGILAGVVLSVLNPAKAQRKASEAVLKSTTEKLCLSMFSCFASSTPDKCKTWADLGFVDINGDYVEDNFSTNPTPKNSYYYYRDYGSYNLLFGLLRPGNGSDDKSCYLRCWYYYNTGQTNNLQEYTGNPAVYDCVLDM